MKSIQLGKEEIKLSLFIDNIIVYVKNPPKGGQKISGTTEYNKVAGCKVNILKSIAFLYTIHEQIEI